MSYMFKKVEEHMSVLKKKRVLHYCSEAALTEHHKLLQTGWLKTTGICFLTEVWNQFHWSQKSRQAVLLG